MSWHPLKRLLTAHRSLRISLPIIVGIAYGAALALILINVQGRIAIESTDVFIYGDTARQIAEGNEISTRMIQPFVTDPLMPQTTWPPFFPILVAVPMLFGVSLPNALLATPIVVLAASGALFVWYVVKRFGWLPAVLFAVFSLTASPLLHTAAQPMTEGVFFGFVLLAVVALAESFERRITRGEEWFGLLAGGLLGALGAIRYLGWSLGPAAIALLFIRRRGRLALAVALGFAITALPLFTRNFILLNEFTNERFPSDVGFFLNIQHAFEGLGKDFLSYQLWQWIRNGLIIALAALGLLGVQGRLRSIDGRALRFGGVLIVLGAVYLSGMIVMRSISFFDELNTPRFVAPVEWLTLAGVSVLIGAVVSRVRLLGVATGLVMLLLGAAALPAVIRPESGEPLFQTGQLIAWAERTTSPDSLIVSNHAQAYAFHLDRTTVVLRRYRSPESLAELEAWVTNWHGSFREVYWVLSADLAPERYPAPVVSLSKGEAVPTFLERLPDPARKIVAYKVNWDALP